MDFKEGFKILQMIDDGTLIEYRQISWMFELTYEELLDAVRKEQISEPINRFGGQYFYRDEIEVYKLNKQKEKSENHSSGSSISM